MKEYIKAAPLAAFFSLSNMTIIHPENPKGLLYINEEDVLKWHALFAEAEKRIKEVEHNNEGLDIPSINELRYVAYHLLDILKSGKNHDTPEKEKVTSHLQRSLYDASEALISIQLQELKKFQDDYRLVPVSEVVKDYQDLMGKAEKASELIQNCHKNHNNREAHYQEALQYVDELKSINSALRVARDELNKRLIKERRESRRWIISIAVAIFGAIVALVIKFAPSPETKKQGVETPPHTVTQELKR